MNNRKIQKVVFHYDDGSSEYLEGDEAKEWLDTVNGHLFISQLHGGYMPPYTWKPVSQESPKSVTEEEDDGYDDGGLNEMIRPRHIFTLAAVILYFWILLP